MRTIAIIARKGGSGKTTVSVHLALAAHLRSLRTMLADTDPQQSSSEALKGRRIVGPEVVRSTGPELYGVQVAAQRAGVDALIIDTPAGHEEDIGAAVVLADLSLLVVRPTFLDIAASLQTATILRRLRKPAMVVLNQAPAPRDGVEPPAVKKALEALRLMQLPVVPAVLRSRAVYQTPWSPATRPKSWARAAPQPTRSPPCGPSSNASPSPASRGWSAPAARAGERLFHASKPRVC